MISPEERLIRAQDRSIRNLEDEVHFLRMMFYDATHDTDCDDPDHDHGEVEIPVQTRREEEVGKSGWDDMCKRILEL